MAREIPIQRLIIHLPNFSELNNLFSVKLGTFESTCILCWNLVHVAHLVNSKACTIIVSYCQDKEMLPCLNMGVSYQSKIYAYERKGDC
jgi:hypothetical protein